MGDNPFLLFWLAVFAIGLLGLAFKAWQWRAIRAGRALPGRHEVAWRNLICSALLAGLMGLFKQLLDYLQTNSSLAAFMIFCATGLALLFAIAALVDRRSGRAAP